MMGRDGTPYTHLIATKHQRPDPHATGRCSVSASKCRTHLFRRLRWIADRTTEAEFTARGIESFMARPRSRNAMFESAAAITRRGDRTHWQRVYHGSGAHRDMRWLFPVYDILDAMPPSSAADFLDAIHERHNIEPYPQADPPRTALASLHPPKRSTSFKILR